MEVLAFALKEGDTVGRVGKPPQAPTPSGEGLPFVFMLVPTRETTEKGTGCQVNLNIIGKNYHLPLVPSFLLILLYSFPWGLRGEYFSGNQ